MSAIYSNNRELIDEETDRAFFVRDTHEEDDDVGPAVEKPIIGGPEAGEPPLHPNHEDRGTREIPVEGAVMVEAADVPPNGQRVWLKGYGCVTHTRDAFEYTGDDIDVVREGDVEVVQWVPADTAVPTRMRTMDGDVTGFAEPGIADYDPDELLQFVRVGFVRIDRHDDEGSVTYYTHP
jgi:glutamyl-tRNA synthetase